MIHNVIHQVLFLNAHSLQLYEPKNSLAVALIGSVITGVLEFSHRTSGIESRKMTPDLLNHSQTLLALQSNHFLRKGW